MTMEAMVGNSGRGTEEAEKVQDVIDSRSPFSIRMSNKKETDVPSLRCLI